MRHQKRARAGIPPVLNRSPRLLRSNYIDTNCCRVLPNPTTPALLLPSIIFSFTPMISKSSDPVAVSRHNTEAVWTAQHDCAFQVLVSFRFWQPAELPFSQEVTNHACSIFPFAVVTDEPNFRFRKVTLTDSLPCVLDQVECWRFDRPPP